MKKIRRALLDITCVGFLSAFSFRAIAAENPSAPPQLPQGSERGPSLGFRSGYGKSFGTAVDSTAESSLIQGMIPFWVDIGYRLNPKLYLGGYFQFALGMVPGDCPGCSANVVRFGFNLHYHLLPGDDYDPWVGIGVGYEILNLNLYPGSGSASLRGFEVPNVQFGVDIRATDNLSAGPFITFALAEYTSASGYAVSGVDKKLHQWLIFGVRAVFDFPSR
jgi:outer membrane protein